MPRKARIDAAGALHHIIVRGIERRRIFSDDQDRDNFVDCLGDIVTATETFCFAWTQCHGIIKKAWRLAALGEYFGKPW